MNFLRSLDDHRCAELDVFKELGRHLVRHSDAAVGCRVTGQVAGVHADAPAGDAHEVRHGRVVEDLAWGNLVGADVHVVVGRQAGCFAFEDAVDG